MKINFVNDTNPKAYRAGLSVFCPNAEMQKRIEENFSKHPVRPYHIQLSDIARGHLHDYGINIPFACGAVSNPYYVIAFRDSFLSVPLRLVKFIAYAYQEIRDQAEEYKHCPREELINSVVASLEAYAIKLDYFKLDFRVGQAFDFHMIAGDYAFHFDYTNMYLEVMECARYRHVGTIDYLINDLLGEQECTFHHTKH